MRLLKHIPLFLFALWLGINISTPDAHAAQRHVGAYRQPASAATEPKIKRPQHRIRSPHAYVELGRWTQRKNAEPSSFSGAAQIGSARASVTTSSHAAMQDQLVWSSTETGGLIAAMTFHSPEAQAIRLGIVVDQLPGSAMLRVYSPTNSEDQFSIAGQRVLQILQTNKDAGDDSEEGNTWWTPEVLDESVTLEIELPPGTPSDDLRIAIPQILHVYENLFLPLENEAQSSFDIQASGTCNQDATCFAQYDAQRNAVARMTYVKNGSGYTCTGTLINDSSNSGTPYFLTANHCISSQTVASTLQTQWFYRSSACNAATLSSASRKLYNGATLLHSMADPDSTLLRLNDTPPAGAVFAGWDVSKPAFEQSIAGIHHPRGDLLKVSEGKVKGFYNCSPFDSNGQTLCDGSTRQNGHYFSVQWSSGTTEPGSSGSGAFSNGQITGILSAGNASCSSTGGMTIYASFSEVFPSIQQWLQAEKLLSTASRQAVYRFFNTATSAHFYTNSAQERDSIISNLPTYRYEGIAFYVVAQPSGQTSGVARFFNKTSNSHFFTINAQERDTVIANLPSFHYEGTAWYASLKQTDNDMRPIYRFYNAQTSTHFYTATEAERDYVQQSLPSYRYEGIAYYVWNTP